MFFKFTSYQVDFESEHIHSNLEVEGAIDTMAVLPHSTDDLTYLYCWVCSEEEDRSILPSSSRVGQGSGDSATTSRFVHPCKCSLVAHEKVCDGRSCNFRS